MDSTDKNIILYDAFISYRHAEVDTEIAETLHRKLEQYRIPKKIQRKCGKKKINRIFRDKEELQLSFSLTDDIKRALDHSEYLIVICSKNACESDWVQREIEYFISVHGQDHILSLLVNDEPGEAFPELLRRRKRMQKTVDGSQVEILEEIEPLAADVRGKNKKERLKKLNQEILRLIAPMIDCTYDELRQRHREYIRRRAYAVGFVSMALVISILSFTLYKNNQVKEADNGRLMEQSRRFSTLAKEEFTNHQILKSVDMALQALPSEANQDSSVMADAQYVLSQVLNCYVSPEEQELTAVASYNLRSTHTDYIVDASNERLFTADNQKIYIWDLETNQLIETLEPETEGDIQLFRNNLLARKQTRLIFSDKKHVFCYNYAKNKYEWTAEAENIKNLAVSSEKEMVFVVEENKLTIRDLKDGQAEEEIPLVFDGCSVSGDAIALSPDQRYLSFDLLDEASEAEYRFDEEDDSFGIKSEIDYLIEKYKVEKDRIALYDLEKKEVILLSENMMPVNDLKFVSNDQLIAVSDQSVEATYKREKSRVQSYERMNRCVFSLVDIPMDQTKWSYGIEFGAFDANPDFIVINDVFMLSAGNKCCAIDGTGGQLLNQWEMDSGIVLLQSGEESIIATCRSGKIAFLVPESELFDTITYYSDSVDRVVVDAGNYFVRHAPESRDSQEESPVLVRYKYVSDNKYVEIDETERKKVEGAVSQPEQQEIYTLPDNSILVMEESDLVRYGNENRSQEICRISLGEDAPSSDIRCQVIDENRIFLIGATKSFEIDISEENCGVAAVIKNFVWYDRDNNRIYVNKGSYSDSQIAGYFPYYSYKDLIVKANQLLNKEEAS